MREEATLFSRKRLHFGTHLSRQQPERAVPPSAPEGATSHGELDEFGTAVSSDRRHEAFTSELL